jgi:hemerythrin superfamily protein
MATSATPNPSSRAKPKAGSRNARRSTSQSNKPADAIKLLKDDHREVKALFEQFEKIEGDADKQRIARQICMALTVHAQIEEEIFYPAAYEAIDDDDLVDEAEVEHATAKHLIARIESSKAGEPLFDAMVKVLGEYVSHHVEEEEGELFPECRDAGMDLAGLGERLAARKAELMEQAGMPAQARA